MQQKSPAIYQIVYRSTAAIGLRDLEIKQILDDARKRNDQDSISGILIVRGTTFIQLLEGEKSKILKTLRRIELDKRHHSLKVLLEGPAPKKMFPKWSMGVVDERTLATSTKDVLEIIDLITKSNDDLQQSILKILKVFSTNDAALGKPLGDSFSGRP